MKILQRWAFACIFLFIISISNSIFAQSNAYPELYGMQRVYKIYNSIYMPKLNAFKIKVDNRVKSGKTDVSDLRDEFNSNFGVLTYPISAAENATAKTLYNLINYAKEDDAIETLCEWERERCVERMNSFFEIDSDVFPDMLGSNRAYKIFDTYYAPRIKSLKQQADNISIKGSVSYLKIAIAINTEFGEWVGYDLDENSSIQEITGALEIAEASLKLKMLKAEKVRMNLIYE